MKTLYFFILTLFIPLLFYGKSEINIETNTPNEVGVNQDFTVSIKLDKADIKDFAKLEISFSSEIEVLNAISYANAMFIAKSNKVKFIWINIPKDKTINLSFLVKFPYYTKRKIEILSEFSFIENKKTHVVSSLNNMFVIPELFANTKTKEQNKISNEELKRRILFELNTNINKNVVYHVQIAALKNNINSKILRDIIEKDFKITETYESGFYKYYIGDFSSLEIANMFKEYCGIKGVFVVSYYNGEKITLNKAKEIIRNKEISENY